MAAEAVVYSALEEGAEADQMTAKGTPMKVTKKLDNVSVAKKLDTLKKIVGTKIKIPMFLSALTVKGMVILIKIAGTKSS